MFAALVSMAPAPVAAVVIADAVATIPAVVATFRLVIVIAAIAAVVILPAYCQAYRAEDHQKTQHHCSL
jgi:hypothetical protein